MERLPRSEAVFRTSADVPEGPARGRHARGRRFDSCTPHPSNPPNSFGGLDFGRSHAQLCWLALLLIRTIEIQVGDPWRNIATALDRMQLLTLETASGTVSQRTRTTARRRQILDELGLQEPSRYFEGSTGDRHNLSKRTSADAKRSQDLESLTPCAHRLRSAGYGVPERPALRAPTRIVGAKGKATVGALRLRELSLAHAAAK